jgi:ribosomal protein L22
MAKTQEKPAVTEVRAQAKWVRCSARKARLVLDTIRGRSVPEARTVLAFSTRASAREIDKVLRSAVANAEANHGLYGDDMIISACYADEGPRLKRWKPRARGRADRLVRPSCHITIKLRPFEPTEVTVSPKASVPKTPEPPKPEPVEAPTTPEIPPPEAAPADSGTVATGLEEAAPTAEPSEAAEKPKPKRRTAAKPRVKKAGEAEAEPKASLKRRSRARKAEE